MNEQISILNEQVKQESAFVESVIHEVGRVIVGQRHMLERLLLGILCDGHVLLEGVPGLAKTLSVRTLSQVIEAGFQRIQFTPDLLPADLIGTMVYNQKTGEFVPHRGPLFTNIVLADEINRAPAKVQSALLEAMQERQVTIGSTTYRLPDPFLVLATENPIEQEGTYPLPEAQVDRFMFKIKVDYPGREDERRILDLMSTGEPPVVRPLLKPQDIVRLRKVVREVYMDDKVKDYIVSLVMATRQPAEFGLPELGSLIEYGASPRATIYLAQAARANAFIRRRGYVTPEDVKYVGLDVLRHRVILTYEAEAEERTPEDIVQKIFDHVEVP
ncbi:MoxR family ATPase [bacterium]|nr:MoxR family ATPase [bacterium]